MDGGLLALTDELLLQILLASGAPAVARCATLCRRLRQAQGQLAALPAFASAACTDAEQALDESVSVAVLEARERMPAAVDVCMLFVAGTARGRAREPAPLARLVPLCQSLLPPGTLVVGCCGRGLFGVEGGAPIEIDPSATKVTGASVLLGRLPGSVLRAFSACDPPAGNWSTEEGCRAWLGLAPAVPTVGTATGAGTGAGLTAPVGTGTGTGAGAGGAPGVPSAGPSAAAAAPVAGLQPLSCLLFAHSSAGSDLQECVEALQATFPAMLLTGGVSSGMGELFCSQALPQLPPPPPPNAAEGPGSPGGASAAAVGSRPGRRTFALKAAVQRERYVGLLICRQPQPAQQQEQEQGQGEVKGANSAGDGNTPTSTAGNHDAPRSGTFRGAALSAQGMAGAEPRLTRLVVTRNFGILQHPGNSHGQPDEMELVGLSGACTARGEDATRTLGRLATRQVELGLWAAEASELGSFDAALSSGQPAVVLQLYGMVEDAEALATANDTSALDAVLAAAEQPGWLLCAQPLQLSPQGAKDALQAGVAQLAAARPPAHPLLPTANCGLVAVSCTAKGRQMYGKGAAGVEAGIIYAASGQMPMVGVYCDGELGPEISNAKAALSAAGTRTPPPSKLQGFTTIVSALAADVNPWHSQACQVSPRLSHSLP